MNEVYPSKHEMPIHLPLDHQFVAREEQRDVHAILLEYRHDGRLVRDVHDASVCRQICPRVSPVDFLDWSQTRRAVERFRRRGLELVDEEVLELRIPAHADQEPGSGLRVDGALRVAAVARQQLALDAGIVLHVVEVVPVVGRDEVVRTVDDQLEVSSPQSHHTRNLLSRFVISVRQHSTCTAF